MAGANDGRRSTAVTAATLFRGYQGVNETNSASRWRAYEAESGTKDEFDGNLPTTTGDGEKAFGRNLQGYHLTSS